MFLVTLVTISGTSLKDFAVAEINKLSSADYVIESTGGTVDPPLVQSARAVHGVQQVVPYRLGVGDDRRQAVADVDRRRRAHCEGRQDHRR